MPQLYQSSALQALYDGTAAGSAATATQLSTFRAAANLTQSTDTLTKSDIEALDRRIATLEQALIGSTAATGKSSAEYPYDRDGLKREFLDEVVALLMRTKFTSSAAYSTELTTTTVTQVPKLSGTTLTMVDDDHFKGSKYSLVKSVSATGSGVFDNLATTGVANTSDPRLSMLTTEGDAIFTAYANLIDAVFLAGDARANNPARAVEVASAMQPITVDGVTYDRVAQTTQLNATTGLAVFTNYLVASTAPDSRVFKDSTGTADLSGPTTTTAQRLQLTPVETVYNTTAQTYSVTLNGNALVLTLTTTGMTVTSGSGSATVTEIPPLLLNVPGRDTEFPDVRILSNRRFTVNGTTYLAGVSTEGKVYVTSLDTTNRTAIGTTANLSGLEYLLFYNEARIRILRAQLAYKEAVVREIQDDLKKANDAMSDIEAQSGLLTATDSDGAKTGQYSSLTFRQSLFQATNLNSGNKIGLSTDSLNDSTEWATARSNLKNYIDRRSSEAQDASLDYQNVLNRFNNALEVMAKLQEKLDTLLKGSLRNIG